MVEPRWLNDEEMRAWRGYRRMRALLDLQISRDLSTDSGLSDADYDVLSTLSESPEHRMRLSELAAAILWSVSRLSHHVTRMQRRGLVVRDECPSDGRGAVLVLTEAGWDAIHAAAAHHVASVRRHLIDLLPPEQISVLADIAETVVGHLSGLAPLPRSRSGRPHDRVTMASRSAPSSDASAKQSSGSTGPA
jgi:DNA-binding MarR family transcriptional regulator